MTISQQWTLKTYWSAQSTGIITIAAVTIDFTDDALPGAASQHFGNIDISGANLTDVNDTDAIIAACKQAVQDQLPGWEAFHAGQLLYLYDIQNSTMHTDPNRTITVDDVVIERSRRLSLGFDFDFGDSRGVHHIATTDEDMKNWSEVSTAAQTAINLGAPDTQIEIKTDTGTVTVTATEWQLILKKAGDVRQPIFAGSFVLEAMTPIHSDYKTNEDYWDI